MVERNVRFVPVTFLGTMGRLLLSRCILPLPSFGKTLRHSQSRACFPLHLNPVARILLMLSLQQASLMAPDTPRAPPLRGLGPPIRLPSLSQRPLVPTDVSLAKAFS